MKLISAGAIVGSFLARVTAFVNIGKERGVFSLVSLLRMIAAYKPQIELKRPFTCYDIYFIFSYFHISIFISSLQYKRDSTMNLVNYSGMRSCLSTFGESNIAHTF